MTLSNSSLMNRFLDGRLDGRSSRMDIELHGGTRCIVGYDWAVYAAEIDGEMVLFGDGYASDNSAVGWAGYSSTTTKHLQSIKRALESRGTPYRVVDARVKVGRPLRNEGVPLGDIDNLQGFIDANEVEPR